MCARCDKPIGPGQAWERHDVVRPSGPGGGTVYLHKKLCERVEVEQPLRYPRGRGAC
jgi:hypothetical protein